MLVIRMSNGSGGSVLRWIIENTLEILKHTPDIYNLPVVNLRSNGNDICMSYNFLKQKKEDYIVFIFNALYLSFTQKSDFALEFKSQDGNEIDDNFVVSCVYHFDCKKNIFSRMQENERSEGYSCFFSIDETISIINNDLDSLYLPDKTEILLKDMYVKTLSSRKEMLKSVKGNMPFPNIEYICNYLDLYMEFCSEIFGTALLFEDGEARTINFFEHCLNIDTFEMESTDKNPKKFLVSMYSPYALASLRNIYTRLSEFITDEKYLKLKDSYADSFVNSVVTNKLLKGFCRYYLKNNTIYYVSIDEGYCINPLNALSGLAWTDLSSIEPISAIDLYEKIVYYLQSSLNEVNQVKENDSVNICILGYIEPLDHDYDDFNEAVQLQRMIENALSKMNEKRIISFDFYINKRLEQKNVYEYKPHLRIHEVNYDEYFAIKTFKEKFIENYDLIFVLDTPFLFQRDLDTITNMSVGEFSKILKRITYDYQYTQAEKSYSKIGVLSSVGDQFILSSLNRGSSCGYVCRAIRTSFYDAIREQINREKYYKEVFFVISAEKEVDITKYERLNVTSTENKNGRHIALIKISNNKLEAKLTSHSDKCKEECISFDLWNLVKNIAPSLRNDIFSLKMQKKDNQVDGDCWKPSLCELQNIRLMLSWKNREKQYPGNFELYWDCVSDLPDFKLFAEVPKNNNEKKIRIITNMFQRLFEAIFDSNDEVIFRCIQKSFGNIFLGRSKTVNEILNYRLLLKNKLEAPECKYDNSKEYSNNYTFNISDKRMYFEIINAFDDSNASDVLQMYNINRARVNGEDQLAVVNNIKNACIVANYKDSNLYNNLILGGEYI